ncbi:MAG: diacylglycerol/lipid kinase family protein [Propylenella sp.]
MPFSCAMRAILVHNSNAGDGRHPADELIDILEEEGISASYYSTKDDAHRNALRTTADLVIAAGGDGTVAKVASGLKHRKTPIAIIPLGTANNVARSLGIPEGPKEAVESWRSARQRRFDVGVASGPWGRSTFLEATGAGAFAAAVAAAEKKDEPDAKPKKQKKLKAARSAFFKALKDAVPTSTRIVADGERLPDGLLLVEIMNIGQMGPRLRLADAADSGDGYLDVVFLAEKGRKEMLDWLDSDDGKASAPVSSVRARKVSIDWDGAPLRVGDEMVEPRKAGGPVRVGLEREGIEMLVPHAVTA